MKRLIAFIVCLALCISSVLIGVMNVANKAEGIASEGALEGLAAGVTSTPTPEVENTNGAIEPDATKGENYYVLTGNLEISSVDDLAAVKDALNLGGTFDGQGYTLTLTEGVKGPIFHMLTAGTIKNLVVDGTMTSLTDDDKAAYGDTHVEHGVFVGEVVTTADITFDTVLVKVVRKNLVKSSGGFVGALNGKVTFKNCEFAGTLQSAGSNWVGGFAVKTDNAAAVATFENCTSSGTIQSGANIGGFFAATFNGEVTFTNCDSSATVDRRSSTANDGTPNMGGFVGIAENMTNGKTFSVTGSTSTAKIYIGQNNSANAGLFFGGIGRGNAGNEDFTISNCTSNGTLSIDETVASTYTKIANLGGFIGAVTNNNAGRTIKIENCTNYTDIDIEVKKQARIGGFIGYFEDRASTGTMVTVTNCVNNGNITFSEVSGASPDGGFCFGGFLGLSLIGMKLELTNFVNNGDIYAETDTNSAKDLVAGGVFGLLGTNGQEVVNVYGGANYGDVTVKPGAGTTNAVIRAGGCMAFGIVKTLNIDGFTNEGIITIDGTYASGATGAAIAAGIASKPGSGTVTVTNSVNKASVTVNNYAGTSETHGITATGTATNCFDVSAVADKTFTAVAGEGAAWTATISKELYAAYGENVEFGAIITLADYVGVIGEFTHANFDAYYTANKAAIDAKAEKELGRLYEIAKFDNGQTTLTDAELVGDNYVVNVRLNGADSYDYVVRTFVKIGDLYIYNN